MSSYASPTDLFNYGANQAALQGFTTQQQQAALDTAASVLDGYLSARFVLPLTSWGNDIRRACAVIAAYDLIMSRGFDPDPSMSQSLETRFKSVQDWLKQIARQEVTPVVTDSSTQRSPADHGGGGSFTAQTAVVASNQFIQPGLNVGGAPPTISENASGGNIVTGPPSLRGW